MGLYTGWTPLVHARRLGAVLGLSNLFLKLESYNWPSYSYKDRVAASALQRAVELGKSTVACVSTGNVGNSVAALAASAGMNAIIFYPTGLEPGKNIMSLMHNASIIELDGSFDDVNAICRQLALESDIPFVNLTLRPYYAEGAKTIAYELVEQLGWRQPDHVVVPTAGAALLTRMAYGFEETALLGLAPSDQKWPRIHAAQAKGCAPIANAFAVGASAPKPCVPDTMAKSIAIGNPSDGAAALEVIYESGGTAQIADDSLIMEAIELLAITEGVFTEPAGGTAVAVARKLSTQGAILPDELAVIVVSGSGLKTQEIGKPLLDRIARVPAEYNKSRDIFYKAVEKCGPFEGIRM